jgi:chemotaxis methyl-accepting protein methylase
VVAQQSSNLPESTLHRMSRSKLLRKCLGRPYLRANIWIWNRLSASSRSSTFVRRYGCHLQSLIQLHGTRTQATGTFFFRNRPELELLIRLLGKSHPGSTVDMAVLGCSKGAEVYSCSYSIRTKRQDLKLRIRAVDISEEMLHFAEAGAYSMDEATEPSADRPSRSIFERMSPEEMEDLFEQDGEHARVRPRFRDGISWRVGDAKDAGLIEALGLQDIVVANRFLCHMLSTEAEGCLRNLARLVKGGGYLFVSGVDLAVRSKVARELGWKPVSELIGEVHEGDPSLRRGWPLQYWGLEPLDRDREDWETRYASVFQIPLLSVKGDRTPVNSGFRTARTMLTPSVVTTGEA